MMPQNFCTLFQPSSEARHSQEDGSLIGPCLSIYSYEPYESQRIQEVINQWRGTQIIIELVTTPELVLINLARFKKIDI